MSPAKFIVGAMISISMPKSLLEAVGRQLRLLWFPTPLSTRGLKCPQRSFASSPTQGDYAMMRRSLHSGSLCASPSLASVARRRARYLFTTIIPGAIETQVFGISNSGQIVGQYLDVNHIYHGMVLSDGSYTSFDVPGSPGTVAYDMNSSGNVVGIYPAPGVKNRAFLRNNGVFTDLVPLAGSPETRAYSINDAGHVVGFYERTNDAYYRGYLYNGSYTTLNYPGALASKATGINNNGDVVGSYFAAGRDSTVSSGAGEFTRSSTRLAASTRRPGESTTPVRSSASTSQASASTTASLRTEALTRRSTRPAPAVRRCMRSTTQARRRSLSGWRRLHGFLATPAAAADFDLDGDVDGDDFLTWQQGLGNNSTLRSDGDATGDGVVDSLDLAAWQDEFGDPGPGSRAVPEPAAMLAALLSVLGLQASLGVVARNSRRSNVDQSRSALSASRLRPRLGALHNSAISWSSVSISSMAERTPIADSRNQGHMSRWHRRFQVNTPLRFG